MPEQRLTLVVFVDSLKGSTDEVYGKLMFSRYRGAKTFAEWRAALDALRSEPVKYDKPVRRNVRRI